MSDETFEYDGMTCEFDEDNPTKVECEDPDSGETRHLDAREMELE